MEDKPPRFWMFPELLIGIRKNGIDGIIGPYRKQFLGQDYCALWWGMFMPDAVVKHEVIRSLLGENAATRVEL